MTEQNETFKNQLANLAGWISVPLLCAPLLLAACAKPATEDLLRQAQELGKQQRWADARPLIKDYLLDHPRDVAGHYLLGQSYLHVPDDFEIPGRGELLAAFRLFERTGNLGMLAQDFTADQFKLMYHQETALTYLRSVRRALQANFPAAALAGHLQEALWHVEEGLKIDGKAHFLLEMKEELTSQLAGLQAEPPSDAPEPYTPAPLPHRDAPPRQSSKTFV